MRCLVVGAGSIGSRRARLLAEMGHEVFLYDGDGERASQAGRMVSESGASGTAYVCPLLRVGFEKNPDAAFICTPPETHIPLALECLRAGVRGVFIEKPLSLALEGVEQLRDAAHDRVVMVACNMRWAYRTDQQPASVRRLFWSSGPLEEWRPGAVAAYSPGGIVLESAIHEIDAAYALGGPVRRVESVVSGGRADLLLEHEDGTVAHIVADWTPEAVPARFAVLDGRLSYPSVGDRMYRDEMAHFLACVESGEQPCNTVDDAAHVLAVALEARGDA